MIHMISKKRVIASLLSLPNGTIGGGRVWSVTERFILAAASVNESPLTVLFFRLHLLIYEPECVDMAREVAKNRQADVNEQIAAASSDERRGCRRKYDGDEDENDV